MSNVVIELPRLHAGQRSVKREAKRFNVLVCGRRWGKTQFFLDLITHPLLKGQPVGYFASRYQYVTEVWSSITRTLAPLVRYQNASQHRLELTTGGVLDMWTLSNEDAGRSRKYARAVIDEAGLANNLKAVTDAAIMPTLIDLRGDLWIGGTPKGLNDFHGFYQRRNDDSEWAAWQRPTTDNPHIPDGEVERIRKQTPERVFNQEYLAQFIDDGAGVFKYVHRARYGAMPMLADLDPRRDYVIGVDLGKMNDYTVFMVVDRQNKQVAYYERMQGDYTVQLDKLVTLCNRLNVTALIVETNTGQMFCEQARARGLRVTEFATTNVSKPRIIENLAVAFERGDITIPDDDVLINELVAYEAERLPSGAVRYGAPSGEGYHDDTVMALAFAWDAIASTVVWDFNRKGFAI